MENILILISGINSVAESCGNIEREIIVLRHDINGKLSQLSKTERNNLKQDRSALMISSLEDLQKQLDELKTFYIKTLSTDKIRELVGNETQGINGN